MCHGYIDEVLNFKWVQSTYEKQLKPYKNFEFTLV
jgi:hypothetical protein